MDRESRRSIISGISQFPFLFFPIRACCRAFITVVLVAAAFSGCEKPATRTLRVGVYENPPKIESGRNGAPRGIFIDILESIAQKEGWRLEYRAGSWSDCLRRLEMDSIDLLPDMALSSDRKERFDFNQLAVLGSWLQVFSRGDQVLEAISDLEGKTLAVLDGSIQQEVSQDIGRRLGVSFTTVALPDYDTCISQVVSGNADAMIVSRFFGYRMNENAGLKPTSILLHPTTLHFASRKGRHSGVLGAIDKHLANMMNRPQSPYYRSIDSWLHEAPQTFIPRGILWLAAAVSVALLFFLVLTIVFRWQVRRRTQELALKNRQLEEALRDLKAVGDAAIKRERLHAVGQLASGIAHDFNNLLVPIIGTADLLLNDPQELKDPEKVRHNLEVVRKAAGHGTDMVQRMQRFYRSVTQPETRELVDLNALIREVVELTGARLRKTAPGASPVEVVIALGEQCEIVGRKPELFEMLLNLVLNAADAMPLGGRLELSTRNSESIVTLRISDTGTGMSKEVREKCVEPFFTTKGEQGTGIGLTMVNNIVAEHGGRMIIESEPGAGTSFILYFPAAGAGFLK